MLLHISLDGNNVKLSLKDGRKTIDEFSWIGEYTLSEQLLPNIDTFLKKHNVHKEDIEKVTTNISKTSGVTSARIVKTVASAWNTAVKTGQG